VDADQLLEGPGFPGLEPLDEARLVPGHGLTHGRLAARPEATPEPSTSQETAGPSRAGLPVSPVSLDQEARSGFPPGWRPPTAGRPLDPVARRARQPACGLRAAARPPRRPRLDTVGTSAGTRGFTDVGTLAVRGPW